MKSKEQYKQTNKKTQKLTHRYGEQADGCQRGGGLGEWVAVTEQARSCEAQHRKYGQQQSNNWAGPVGAGNIRGALCKVHDCRATVPHT